MPVENPLGVEIQIPPQTGHPIGRRGGGQRDRRASGSGHQIQKALGQERIINIQSHRLGQRLGFRAVFGWHEQFEVRGRQACLNAYGSGQAGHEIILK